MEMGSGSLTESGGSSTNSSAESFNGLKFGKHMGTPSKLGHGSSSSSGSGRKARVGGMVQGVQAPRCQVEGCEVDLSGAKAYYSRHKVCCMHSKSSKVIVAGLEQRFCQQCSRFHQLSEFDKGKRSCRRRLAGHNERRRKSLPGSLFSSPYDGRSSSFIENGYRGGTFIVDFSAYHRLSRRDVWPTGRSSEHLPVNQNTATGRSPCGISFSGKAIPNGKSLTGSGGDSSCALSLLSNQPWGSRNQDSSFAVNDMISTEGSNGAVVNPYPNTSWGFNSNDSIRCTQEMPPHLDLGQISDLVNCQFSSGLELSQQSRRPYMELERSRAAYDDSMQHVHWSL